MAPLRKESRRDAWLAAVLMLIGVLVRMAALGRFPGGINQDEAYAAYEAFCLLDGGMDSWGYRFPVYLTAWGSGMNVLESWLMTPFIALFGLESWAVRLPQALLACASLAAMYALAGRLFGRRAGQIALGFLAICPWHITMARWGLESNLAPGLILLGLYFFVRGVDNPKFYLLSGVAYGLSLYAYAAIWVVLPFMLLFHALYLWFVGKLRVSRWLIAGAAVLGLMAAPLLLFLAVNWGVLPEIRTALFSIPRMPQMRGDEVTLTHLYENVYRLVKTFLLQRDDMVWNASDAFGLYYHISLPFMALGGMVCLARTVKSIRARAFDGSALALIWLLLGAAQGCMIDGNVNRLNFLHMPIILCTALGIAQLTAWMKGKWRVVSAAVAAAYAASFVLFAGYYFTDYQDEIAPHYDAGLGDALAYAQTLTDGEIVVSEEIIYSKVLFYAQIEPETFRETVKWRGEPGAFMRIDTVDRYRFAPVGEANANVCVMKAAQLPQPLPEGAASKVFGSAAVVFPADPH